MKSASIFFGVGAALGVVYVLLAFAVLVTLSQEKKQLIRDQWPVFFFWWPFYRGLYVTSDTKLHIYGRVVFVLIVAAYTASFLLEKPA